MVARCNGSSAVGPEILSFVLVSDLSERSDCRSLKVTYRLLVPLASCSPCLKPSPRRPFVLPFLFLPALSAVVGCPSITTPFHLRRRTLPTATSTTSRLFPFTIQRPIDLQLRRSLPPVVPPPSADQHRARVSSLVRRIGVALSVSGTVRLVTTSGAATRPRLLAPRTLVPTYASCSAPRVCLAFSPIDFPLP
jgi:hypothetical protein